MNKKKDIIFGDHGLEYLYWRYQANPEHNCKILRYKGRPQKTPGGYLIYYVDNGRLEIYDFLAPNLVCFFLLIQKAARIARRENCHGVYISMTGNNPYLKSMKFLNFWQIQNERVEVLYWGKSDLLARR